ncbi:unnamed protein product [Phaedon cochleariae]|uniref:TLC domain-containing protein n=1 Tax=Phaedon cochleariae TaxID=80249 RepID=A0A9N9SD23_PHACE|nr:unnamed protein product [Phaedon cochleariae]
MKPKIQVTDNVKKEQKKTAFVTTYLILAGLSLLISILTVIDLDWEEHISIRRGLLLFVSGLLFFTCLYLTINTLFLHTTTGRKIVKRYKLESSDIYDISNKQVSAVQALFCCLTGLTSICYSCSRNILKTSHYISEAYGWFGAAYFAYDIWSMYEVYTAKRDLIGGRFNRAVGGDGWAERATKWAEYLVDNAVIVGHHVFIGGFGFLVITSLRGGLGDCFFGFIYLMEASTPFVSLRGILSKIGLKNTPIYVINGLMMLAAFFVCRIAMFPYVIHLYSKSIKVDFISALHTLPRGCLISIAILLLPQIYWFYLMLVGATKVLKKSVSNNNNLRNFEHN